jgi:hypothetical protein
VRGVLLKALPCVILGVLVLFWSDEAFLHCKLLCYTKRSCNDIYENYGSRNVL